MRLLTTLLLLFASSLTLADAPLKVVTTIKPIYSLLAGLLQGTAPPQLLLDGDRLPYQQTLNTTQRNALQQADLVVWIGPELEQLMVNPISNLGPNTTVLTLLDNEEIKVLPSRWDENRRDPFFWLDSRNVIILADELARALIRIDPERSELYQSNRRQLLMQLSELDRQLEYGYRGLKSGIGMAYYDTLQYFEQAYALKIRGVVAESPTTQMSGLSLLQNRARLKSGDYSCLLTEQQMEMGELALLIQDIPLNIGTLDSFGTSIKPGKSLYFELMRRNTSAIKQCLRYDRDALTTPLHQQESSSLPTRVGGKFMLQDHHGRLFSDRDMAGKLHLIYFGYTFCPDVCPTSLIALSAALGQLGEKAEQIQPYFITVDPQRDTPEVLKTYVTYFHPSLIGLTGTEEMVKRVAEEYRVQFERVEDPSRSADEYIIDHSAGLYLMGADGSFITKFAHGIAPSEIAKRLEQYLD